MKLIYMYDVIRKFFFIGFVIIKSKIFKRKDNIMFYIVGGIVVVSILSIVCVIYFVVCWKKKK